jgi:hypothetical protein
MAKPAIVTVRRLFDEPSDGRAELGIAKAASIIAGRSRDAQDIDSLNKTADGLLKAAGNNQGPGADAARNLAAHFVEARRGGSNGAHAGSDCDRDAATLRP